MRITMGVTSLAFGIAVGLAALSGCGNNPEEGLSGGDSSKTETAVMGTGVIDGKITLMGRPPQMAVLDFSADPVCRNKHRNPMMEETVKVDKNGDLANVFVYVKEGAGIYPPPSAPVTLDQRGCMYYPHVFGIQAGQPLMIVNDDPTLHNIHSLPVTNEGFNVGQPSQGDHTEKKFAKPEVMVKFKCDVHSWMHCYGGVVTNPFFSVSGSNGSFMISGLPPGNYTIEAWHEKYGTLSQKVEVEKGEMKKVNFIFATK